MYQPGLPSVDTEWSPPAMDAVPILLSLCSIPVVTPSNMSPDCTRGRLRLNLRLILTTDTDTYSDTDTVWDTDIVWDTTVTAVDTTAMDTDTDSATMYKMEALNSACAIVISTLQ